MKAEGWRLGSGAGTPKGGVQIALAGRWARSRRAVSNILNLHNASWTSAACANWTACLCRNKLRIELNKIAKAFEKQLKAIVTVNDFSNRPPKTKDGPTRPGGRYDISPPPPPGLPGPAGQPGRPRDIRIPPLWPRGPGPKVRRGMDGGSCLICPFVFPHSA